MKIIEGRNGEEVKIVRKKYWDKKEEHKYENCQSGDGHGMIIVDRVQQTEKYICKKKRKPERKMDGSEKKVSMRTYMM